MKKFKLRPGLHEEIYEISRSKFEELTRNHEPYTMIEKDGEKKNFAVCPACDNPIQLIGLYKKLENTAQPYGKHYNRDVENLAMHNEQAYRFCPYASHKYKVNKAKKRDKLTDFERKIYYSMRENFDLVVEFVKRETGIFISNGLAEEMLYEYLASKGYMYYWAALYNIPWMLLYFTMSKKCYKMMVKKGSEIHQYLATRKDVKLVRWKDSDYDVVKNNGRFLDIEYTAIHHNRFIRDDEVVETIQLIIVSDVIDHRINLTINESRFPNYINSKAAQSHRNQKLLDIAKRLMPDLPEEWFSTK